MLVVTDWWSWFVTSEVEAGNIVGGFGRGIRRR